MSVALSTLLYSFFVQSFLVISHPEQIIQKSSLAGDEREGEGENDEEMTPVWHLCSLGEPTEH